MRFYFNLICEEISITGGKIIHFDENMDNIQDVHNFVSKNYEKYPNAKWEMYPFSIEMH